MGTVPDDDFRLIFIYALIQNDKQFKMGTVPDDDFRMIFIYALIQNDKQ